MYLKEWYQGAKKGLQNEIEDFSFKHPTLVSGMKTGVKYGVPIILLILLPRLVYPQTDGKGLTEEQAKVIDISVANNAGIDADFHTYHMLATPSGNWDNYWMATMANNDTASGGDLSGYTYKNRVSTAQWDSLQSLPNTCFSIVDLDTCDGDSYQKFAEDHWKGCGYFVTDVSEMPSLENLTVSAFPNPFTNKTNVNVPKNSQVTITDMSGRVVYENGKVPGKTIQWGDAVSSGMYILNAQTDKGIGQQKLIKKQVKK